MAKSRSNTKLEKDIAAKPQGASAKKEADFIIAHWKFRRAVELMDDGQKIKKVGKVDADEIEGDTADSLLPLTCRDIENAPSQTAVTRLIHAIKYPKGWQDTLMAVAKAHLAKDQKSEGGEDPDDDEVEDDTSELDKLIAAGKRTRAALERIESDG